MLNPFIKMTDEERVAVRNLITELQSDESIANLSAFDSLEKRIESVRMTLPEVLTNELTNNDIELLLETSSKDVNEVEKALLEKHGQKLHPHVKLALQTALCIGAIYYTPSLLALHSGTQLSKKIIGKMAGNAYRKDVDRIVPGALLAVSSLGGIRALNILAQMQDALPEVAKVSLWRQIPAWILAQSLINNASAPIEKIADLAMENCSRDCCCDVFCGLTYPVSWGWKQIKGATAQVATQDSSATQITRPSHLKME